MVFIPIKLSKKYYVQPSFWSSNCKKPHATEQPKTR